MDWTLFALGTFCLGAAGWFALKIVACRERTMARIEDVRVIETTEVDVPFPTERTFAYKYRFTFEDATGRSVTIVPVFDPSNRRYEPGDRVPVRYCAARPSLAMIDAPAHGILPLLSFLGLALLAFGALALHSRVIAGLGF